jgi:hypothetical protein
VFKPPLMYYQHPASVSFKMQIFEPLLPAFSVNQESSLGVDVEYFL